MKFDYGDVVKVSEIASQEFRPGDFGSVCGMRHIKSEGFKYKVSDALEIAMYTVEYADGTDMEIPEEWLTLYVS